MQPPASLQFNANEILTWVKQIIWERLEIRQTVVQDNIGTVEFVAYYSHNHTRNYLHETSSFCKVNNQWFYVDGKVVTPTPIVRDTQKISRNEACPCQSQKKYKKCCGNVR